MTFDRNLSLAIDALHARLDSLNDCAGWRTFLLRQVLRWRLRRLERRLPEGTRR